MARPATSEQPPTKVRATIVGSAALLALVAGLAVPSNATAAPAASAAYYLDSARGDDGNDGTSPSRAWRSLDRAGAAVLRPGDRLRLKRGQSWGGVLLVDESGTPRRQIIIDAYGAGALPVIHTGGPNCVVLAGSNITVSGLHVDDCGFAGIDVLGSRNTIRATALTRNAAGVQVGWDASHTRIVGNDLSENNKMSVLTPGGNDDSGAFGILVHGQHTEVAHNTISGSDAFSYDYGRDGSAIEIYGGRSTVVHHNRVLENNGFAELGHPISRDNTFAYNAVFSSLDEAEGLVTRGAADTFGPILRTTMDNNTIYLAGENSQGFVCYAGCGPDVLTMRNNIIHAGLKVGYSDGAFVDRRNVYSGDNLEFTPGASSVVTDPLLADPARGDLHLRPDSPAVDFGAQLGWRADLDGTRVPVDGDGDGIAAPDAGAFEYQAR